MYNKNHLLKDLRIAGMNAQTCTSYGKGAVIQLDLQPEYRLYVAQSNIGPCFWNVTRQVIDDMVSNKEDFGLVLMDTRNDQVYFYDKQQALTLLAKSSHTKKYGNYRITSYNVANPVNKFSLFEFFCEELQ